MPNLVGIGNSQVPTNAMLGRLAYQDSVGEIAIDKIKARTSDTALGVFIYDTRKDSDGGAWRHRTQNTSWYDEVVSAERGARREFPAVAVIVVTSTLITIYDGDDPNLPMWMVLNETSNGTMLYSSSGSDFSGAVSALNGNIYYGMTGNGTLGIIEFVRDGSFKHRRNNRSNRGRFLGRIADRNLALGWRTENDIRLAGEAVSDIATTVLPNAPIETSTRLPIPTIAAATDAGVSVIKDDGTISDLTPGGGVEMNSVSFDENNNLVMGRNNFILYRSDNPHYLSNQVDSGYTVNNRGNSAPSVGEDSSGSTSLTDVVATSDSSIAFDTQTLGLGLYDVNAENNSNSMVAYIRATHNTGHMIGDIKGAFLSDTDDTDITGSELVTNGTFAGNNVTGWTEREAGGSFTASGGQATLTYSSGVASWRQDITIVSGETYTLSFDIVSTTTSSIQFYYNHGSSGGDLGVSLNGSAGKFSVTFVAASNSVRIFPRIFNSGNMVLDNISLRIAEEDRSVNNKGIQVFGTIKKDPVATGAELVAYHGVNSTNYLRQPYNADLNFGTGDFSIFVWVKKNTFSTNHYIIDRARTLPSWDATNRTYFIINYQGYHRFRLAGGSQVSGSVRPMKAGVFNHVGFVRRNGTMEFWLNGELVETVTGSDASASFHNGGTDMSTTVNRYGNGFAADYTFDRMALLRISGTAPSSEQVKKMYNDEKCLFHENAKCTLHGTSDDIKALAFDDTNDVLHVGTSAGRSEFRGLNRINNTTTAVTTAISASNGLVAEQ